MKIDTDKIPPKTPMRVLLALVYLAECPASTMTIDALADKLDDTRAAVSVLAGMLVRMGYAVRGGDKITLIAKGHHFLDRIEEKVPA